jgi:hypothetical protein
MIKLKHLIMEGLESNRLYVVSNRQNVSVSVKLDDLHIATASIDNIEGNEWWVSRVLVGRPHAGSTQFRGKGVGSMILTRAVQEVFKNDPKARIVAEPGGSYGSKEEDQIRFYKHNGFVDVPGHPGVLVYGGNQ